jgi:hypothetical protein
MGIEIGRSRTRIRDVIEATTYYDLNSQPSRFYLVENFEPTEISKSSSGGIMGMRYLDLEQLLDNESADSMPTNKLAVRLSETTFS